MKNLPDINRPGIAIFDMDSTLIQIESIDAIAEAAGHGAEVAQITERAMQGELDFTAALQQRVQKLRGVKESLICQMAEHLPYSEGADALLQFFKKHRWRIAIVSGGFTWFADAASMRFGADYVACNVLEVEKGKLTGRLLGAIVDANAKANALKALMLQYGIEQTQTIAVGDGANDIPMLQAAGLGVAYNAKPVLHEIADIRLEGSLAGLIDILS